MRDIFSHNLFYTTKNILAIQIPGDDMINPSPKSHRYSGIRG